VSSTRLISVVIPCYNYGRYLPDCLNSVLQQHSNERLEAIVVDDASTDETPQVLSAIRDARVRVIRHPVNKGHVAALWSGFQAAQGDFISRLDADDRYRPNFLSTLLPKLEAHPEVGMAYGDAALIDEQGRVSVERTERYHQGRENQSNLLTALLQYNITSSATAIGRREAWEGVLPREGEYPGKANDDWYYNVMIARRWEHYYVNEVVSEVRVHPGGSLHTRVILDGSEEAFVMWFLDWMFAHPESNEAREAAKQQVRDRAYGAQYLSLAYKYLSARMNADARRCFFRAIRHHPRYLLQAYVLRHTAATIFGRERYEAVKSVLKR
jgi:glycosyltransferase involved in cell wall biosynthesis